MNTLSKQLMKLSALMMAIVLLAASCKRAFDEPPYNSGDPDIKITHTIKQLQEIRTQNGNKDTTLATDVVIAGVVIGDDKSGNLFKQIVIQDESAGINIQLDASNLNATYPAGRRVFVKAKGLTLGAYGGMMQLGLGMNGTSPARIPQSVIGNYLVAGSSNNVVTPVELEISQVTSSYQNMLVKLKDVQIAQADLSKTYADPSQAVSAVNINMEDCKGGKIILRSSSFANFAGNRVPQGKGNITGIYTFFNTTAQFVIRDTTDVAAMTGTRCGSTGGGTAVTSISALRALYTGSDVVVANGSIITGVVVSNSTNESAGNFRLVQTDNNAGVIFRMAGTGAPVYTQGTTLTIDISGGTLTSFQGEIQIGNVAANKVNQGSAGTVTPRVATIQQIITSKSSWASTLVKINNVTVSAPSASGTTGNNYTITDATGNVVAFIRNTSGITLPQGTATSITGYVGVYLPTGATDTTAQLGIRLATDLENGGGTPGGGTGIALTTSPLKIDFNNIGTALPTGITGRTAATATSLGTETGATLTPGATTTGWAVVGGGFKNYASATGLDAATTAADQATATNRALGIRQVGVSDKEVAFVFELNNTLNKNNLKMSFLLQSLDAGSPRITTWSVDYANADAPTSFSAPQTVTGTLTTGNSTFSSNTINVDFGSALNNKSGKIFIRIVALGVTTGSGNRATSAIDDVQFTWN